MTQMLEPTLHSGLDTGTVRLRRSVSGSTGPQALPDLLLIERARAGEGQAMEALIRRYSGRLYRVAYSVLLDTQRSEAAVLEAFLAAFSDLSRYEPTACASGRSSSGPSRRCRKCSVPYTCYAWWKASAASRPLPRWDCTRPRCVRGCSVHTAGSRPTLSSVCALHPRCSSWLRSAPSVSPATRAPSCLTARY